MLLEDGNQLERIVWNVYNIFDSIDVWRTSGVDEHCFSCPRFNFLLEFPRKGGGGDQCKIIGENSKKS